MQFNVAVILAAMATVAVAHEGHAHATGTAVASTGVVTAPTPTGSPIYTGGAGVNGVSAFGLVVAGALALFI